VYHAQPRFGLKRISCTDHGEPGAAVLKLAGFCVWLKRRPFRHGRARCGALAAELMLSPVATPAKSLTSRDGRVAEWFKAPVLKFARRHPSRCSAIPLSPVKPAKRQTAALLNAAPPLSHRRQEKPAGMTSGGFLTHHYRECLGAGPRLAEMIAACG
jgi:hypothetical protein